MKQIRLTLVFNVIDEDVLRKHGQEVYQYESGQSIEDVEGESGLAGVAAEVLLHSNTGVLGYNDYGLEWLRQETETYEI